MDRTLSEMDSVARYAAAVGLSIRRRTVLVEGTTDLRLFGLTACLERREAGVDLFAGDLAIVAAGEADRGGAAGVIRELIGLRGMARTCLLPNGRPRYRFIALLDNDRAGRKALQDATSIDNSIIRYRDVFLLQPAMPLSGNLDPGTVARSFADANAPYSRLDWELEDLLPGHLFDALEQDHPHCITRTECQEDKVHRHLTTDGKARLHTLVRDCAIHRDLAEVAVVLRALRHYLNL